MLSWGLLSSSSLSSCCHCLEVGWPAGLIGDLYQQKEDDLLVRKICCPLLFYQVLHQPYSVAQKPRACNSDLQIPPSTPTPICICTKAFSLTGAIAFAPRASSLSDTFAPRDPSLTDAVAFAPRAFLWGRRGVQPQSVMLHSGPTGVSPSTTKVALLHLHQLLFAWLVTKANSILITEPATYV